MANRFATNRSKSMLATARDLIVSVSLFAVVLVFFFWGVSSIGETTEEEKLQAVQSAVTKSVVQCYAVEGRYPTGLGYLEAHYGLRVDYERYIVHYEPIADNIMPQVMVLPR